MSATTIPSAEEIAKAIADRFDVRWPIADETQFPPPVTPDQLKAFCVEALTPLLSRLAEAEKRNRELEEAIKAHQNALRRLRSSSQLTAIFKIDDPDQICDFMEESMKECKKTEDSMFAALEKKK